MDRATLLARQRSGRCLTCGGSGHRTENCRKGRYPQRSPTPNRSRPGTSPRRFSRPGTSPQRSRSNSQQKVNFRVHSLDQELTHSDVSIDRHEGRPPALGREGDVLDDADKIVDEYIGARSIDFFPAHGRQNIADYEYSSQSDE